GLANIADICEGTNVGDRAFYFGRKRNVNDFHGLGAFLIMNEYFLTGESAMELTNPRRRTAAWDQEEAEPIKNLKNFSALVKHEEVRLTQPASVTVLAGAQASNISPGGGNSTKTGDPVADAVKYFSSAEVHGAFEKGSPILNKDGRTYWVL